jgi:uncharacterized surface protein with fasciclin (FAS1) repeats
MTYNKNKYFLMLLLVATVFSACKKQWDQRDAVTDQQLNKNLLQQIQGNPDLSTFAGYISKIGYDKVLASSKTFTVWAPTNAALATMDAATVNDTAKLHVFVNSHIANQAYLTTNAQPSLRIRTLTGKNVTFTATTVDDASITAANQYVSNGVVHVINKALTPKLNIYEYVKTLTGVAALHRAYLLRQDTSFVDTSKATVASIDPKTGKPILVANTGVVIRNKYFTRVADLGNEDVQYTYFVLTDAAYNTETAKVSKYFTTVTNNADTTVNILAGFNVLKDMVVDHVVLPADLPATLMSTNGVPIPIDKTAIVQTYNASNGIVYVISKMNFAITDKITPFTIQGEVPSFYARTDQSGKINFRARIEPTGIKYTDLLITGANLPASFFAGYKLSNLYTCQYKVVIRAVNDTAITKIAAPGNISQRVTFGHSFATTVVSGTITPVTAVNFPYANITPYNYAEVTLTGATGTTVTTNTNINVVGGTLNVLKYASVNMYVQGANATATNTNNVIVDYIKLYPIIQ